jgi:hypothetical protein
MLRFKILASVVPLMAAAVLARGGLGSTSHPCIAFGETPVELASVPWTASLHVAFTHDPARATVRVQITDDADAADFALVDDGTTSESGVCQSSPATRYVAISPHPTGDGPVIYLSSEGPADYRIYVRSKTFSQRDAAALIVGASGTGPTSRPPRSEHDPEKCEAVFRNDHAQTTS